MKNFRAKDWVTVWPLAALLAFMAFSAACGGGEAEEAASTEPVELKLDHPPLPEDAVLLVDTNPDLTSTDIQLSSTRYMDEMIQAEIRKTYGTTGEYIDPRRVMQLLNEEALETTTQEVLQEEEPVLRTWRISDIVHNEAKALYEQGRLPDAAQRWRALPTDSRVFTLSVQVHCDEAELRRAYAELIGLDMPIFILPQDVKGRNCYRLCAGIFATRSDAQASVLTIKELLTDTYPFVLPMGRSAG